MSATAELLTAAQLVEACAGRLLTIADWLEFGETEQKFELTEGNLVMTPRPTFRHMSASGELHLRLRLAVPAHLRVVYEIDVDLQLATASAPATVRVPDLVVVTQDEATQVRDRGVVRASGAVLVIEIVSPSSVRTDQLVKRREYADAGIAHYWIVDLDPRPALTACRLVDGSYADDGPVSGIVETTEPFALTIDLDTLG